MPKKPGQKARSKLWFRWYEWLIIIGIPVVVMSVLLPHLLRIRKEEMPRVEQVMKNIYVRMAQGMTDKDIRDQITNRDKKVIEKHQIFWDSNVFPILFQRGKLKNKYYPPSHVVVYAKPFDVWTKKRFGRYFQAIGKMFGREDPNEIDRLVDVTKFGTFDILLGDISDSNAAAKKCDLTDDPEIYSYLLLKALLLEDKDFVKYAVILAANKNHLTNEWLAEILRSAIVSPSLPELPTMYEKEKIFYNNLSEWFEKNKGKIQFVNTFLFENSTQSNVR